MRSRAASSEMNSWLYSPPNCIIHTPTTPPPPNNHQPPHALQRHHGNKDGKVSPAEYSADALAAFDRLDTNKDGTVSPEEKQAATRR